MGRRGQIALACSVLALALLDGAAAAAASPHHGDRAQQRRLAKLRRAAAPKGPLGHAGRWITDSKGRVVILHGLNMVAKRPPYAPDALGFGADDAKFLRANGFNTVRLGLIYKGVEPSPGQYDGGYLARIAKTEQLLGKQGVFSLLDFHQDLYNEKFGGEGFPDWAVLDDGVSPEPLTGFPGSYLSSPGLNRAFDNFWANKEGPDGVPIQDRYGAAWRQVASGFSGDPHVLGYDLLNEPWPGSAYLSCIGVMGCPTFDQNQVSDFVRRVIGYIRQGDGGSHIAFYEPLVTFNFGAATSVDPPDNANTGMSFHDYCLATTPDNASNESCQTSEPLAFQNADSQSQRTGDGLILSEFGATTDLAALERIEGLADQHMVSWQEWHYCACEDPTTSGPGDSQALVLDPAKPPSGANVETAKLKALERPYPQAVAGTPKSWSFNPDSRRFELGYLKVRPSNALRIKRGVSDVFVPKLQYPKGYRVTVHGAQVISKRNRQHLILWGKPKAASVEVTVTPR